MHKLFFTVLIFFHAITLTIAQPAANTKQPAEKESPERHKAKRDSLRMQKFLSMAEYPLIKASKWSGCFRVKNPDEIPDPNIKYKLLFELTYSNPDSLAKEINRGLAEIGRIINLHVASGIPVKNIETVVVVHGPALHSFYTEDRFQKNYHCPNPNPLIIRELKEAAGTRFIACGQAMAFQEVPREELMPGIKVSLTAQTVLSGYQLKGYVLCELPIGLRPKGFAFHWPVLPFGRLTLASKRVIGAFRPDYSFSFP